MTLPALLMSIRKYICEMGKVADFVGRGTSCTTVSRKGQLEEALGITKFLNNGFHIVRPGNDL